MRHKLRLCNYRRLRFESVVCSRAFGGHDARTQVYWLVFHFAWVILILINFFFFGLFDTWLPNACRNEFNLWHNNFIFWLQWNLVKRRWKLRNFLRLLYRVAQVLLCLLVQIALWKGGLISLVLNKRSSNRVAWLDCGNAASSLVVEVRKDRRLFLSGSFEPVTVNRLQIRYEIRHVQRFLLQLFEIRQLVLIVWLGHENHRVHVCCFVCWHVGMLLPQDVLAVERDQRLDYRRWRSLGWLRRYTFALGKRRRWWGRLLVCRNYC